MFLEHIPSTCCNGSCPFKGTINKTNNSWIIRLFLYLFPNERESSSGGGGGNLSCGGAELQAVKCLFCVGAGSSLKHDKASVKSKGCVPPCLPASLLPSSVCSAVCTPSPGARVLREEGRPFAALWLQPAHFHRLLFKYLPSDSVACRKWEDAQSINSKVQLCESANYRFDVMLKT